MYSLLLITFACILHISTAASDDTRGNVGVSLGVTFGIVCAGLLTMYVTKKLGSLSHAHAPAAAAQTPLNDPNESPVAGDKQ
jgi:hypothetical protein